MLEENILPYHVHFKVNPCLWSFRILPFYIDFFNNKFVPLCYFPLKSSSLNYLKSTAVTGIFVLFCIFFWWGEIWNNRYFNYSVLPFWRHKSDLLLLKKHLTKYSIWCVKYISYVFKKIVGRCWNFIQKSSMNFYSEKKNILVVSCTELIDQIIVSFKLL